MAVVDELQDNKPKRIRALLSSFLKRDTKPNRSLLQPVSTVGDTSDAGAEDHSIAELSPAVTIQPLSRESFIQRVDTFTTGTWFAKPHSLSPLHCARYGWQNTDVDTLSCVSCKELLVVSLPPSWQKEEYSKACDNVSAQLISSHGKICPWSGSPSPESFVTVAMTNAKQEIARYQDRVRRLLEIFSNLPCIEFSVLKDQSLEDNAVLDRIVEYTKTVADSKEDVSGDAWNIIVMMALFGWYKSDHSSLPVVKCECCRKQAGLWNYATPSDESAGDQEQDTDEPPKKKIKITPVKTFPHLSAQQMARCDLRDLVTHADEGVVITTKALLLSLIGSHKDIKLSSFHPASEHRPWCPWIYCDPYSSKDGSKDTRPAWLRLLDILLSKADPSQFGSTSPLTDKIKTPPNNAWKAVRRLVSFWQSSSSPVKDVGSSPTTVKT